MSELKKCPFCGDDDQEALRNIYGDISTGCGNSDCPIFGTPMPVEFWQTRPIEDALQARIDELELQLRTINALLGEKPVDMITYTGTNISEAKNDRIS